MPIDVVRCSVSTPAPIGGHALVTTRPAAGEARRPILGRRRARVATGIRCTGRRLGDGVGGVAASPRRQHPAGAGAFSAGHRPRTWPGRPATWPKRPAAVRGACSRRCCAIPSLGRSRSTPTICAPIWHARRQAAPSSANDASRCAGSGGRVACPRRACSSPCRIAVLSATRSRIPSVDF